PGARVEGGGSLGESHAKSQGKVGRAKASPTRARTRGSRMLGVCIVGCGMIARFHARALQEVPNTRLLALVSRSRANAEKLEEEVGLLADWYPDLGPMLERRDIHL